MSRIVIHDIVLPIVQRIMYQNRFSSYHQPIIQDPNLEQFLEEELRRRFGVIGANDCQHLREQLEEAKRNDPYALEQLVKQLLNQYVSISVKLRTAKKNKHSKKKNANGSKKKKERIQTN